MRSVRFATARELTDPEALSRVLGPVSDVTLEPMPAAGFTGARFERLHARLDAGRTRDLVLKRARLGDDWTAWRTADRTGRATLPLDEPALDAIWGVYACPYLAHANDEGEVALLMEDLGPHLLPDVRAPLERPPELALVDALARLHATFWNSSALDDARLATAPRLLGMLGPRLAGELGARADVAPVIERAQEGWAVAFRHLPPAIAVRLMRPPDDIVRAWGPLPRTLLHGDAKVANFAILADRRVAAFDWGCIAAGPPALDVGWYLAVNATRIRVSKEALLALYRERLERALGSPLGETTWSALVAAAIEAGAMLLLWSKALALERGDAVARAEWDWWTAHLASV